MKLYLIHCGYYDTEVCDGVYESHVNLFQVASSAEEAKRAIRQDSTFRAKKMHVDGVQEISVVNGYRIRASLDESLQGVTSLGADLARDL